MKRIRLIAASLAASALSAIACTAASNAPQVTTPSVTAGHTLLKSYSASDMYGWRYYPGTKTPVSNGGGACSNNQTPGKVTLNNGNVTITATGPKDCGDIQSPVKLTTASGIIEARVKFPGVGTSTTKLANWGGMWMYGDNWPANGELDAVESQYGTSYVSYYYGSSSRTQYASDQPSGWGQNVVLRPEAGAADVLPGWHTVDVKFSAHEDDVYYDGHLYQKVSGSYVTGKPMYLVFSTEYGAPNGLGANQKPYDAPASILLSSVKVYS